MTERYLTLAGDEAVAVGLRTALALARSRALVVDLSRQPARTAATALTAALIERLRANTEAELLSADRTIILVVLPVSGEAADIEATAGARAAVFAARGIVQSLTRELAHRSTAINAVAVTRDRLADVVPLLHHLDEADGGYTAGITFDLTAVTP